MQSTDAGQGNHVIIFGLSLHHRASGGRVSLANNQSLRLNWMK
jgi:hypothetical protein